MNRRRISFCVAACISLLLPSLNNAEDTTTEVFVTDIESPDETPATINVEAMDDILFQNSPSFNPALPRKKNISLMFPPSTPSKCKCGVSKGHRIVNGDESAPNAWPWMGALTYQRPKNGTTSNSKFQGFCGGSIINDQYILTAAHCVTPLEELGLANIWVIVGDNNINGVPSVSRQVVGIHSARAHPKYMTGASPFNYDVGLIKLATKLDFNEDVLPICLGQAGAPFTNKNATLAGWGLIQGMDSDTASNSLRQTTLQVLSQKRCKALIDSQGSSDFTENMLCAFSPRSSACNGDSGGPLIVPRASSPEVFKQIGIVSFGDEGCPPDVPAVFTRIQKVLSWIKAFTKDGMYCGNSFTP